MKHSFEDQFKQAMQQAEEPLNVDKLWSKVEERTFGKRRKLRIIYIALPLLLLTAFYLGYQASNNTQKQTANKTQIDHLSTKTKHASIIEEKKVYEEVTDLKEATRLHENDQISEDQDAKIRYSTSTKSATSARKTKSSEHASAITNSSLNLDQVEHSGKKTQTTVSASKHAQQTQQADLKTHAHPTKNAFIAAKNNQKKTPSLSNPHIHILAIQNQTPSLFPWEIRNPVYFNEEDIEPIIDMEKLAQKWQQAFVLSSSFGKADKMLRTKDSLGVDYLNLRNTTELHRESWTLAPNMQWKHANGFILEAGIHYHRINEQFNWSGTYTETDGEIYKDLLIIDSAGDSIRKASVGSTELNQWIITRNMSINNSYHQLGIMAGTGYQFSYKKWSASPMVYGHLNVLTWAGQKDYILESTAKPGLLNQQVTNDVSLAYSGKITIGYDVSDKLSLGLNAQYRMVPNVLKSELPISQTYGFTGLGLALGYKW